MEKILQTQDVRLLSPHAKLDLLAKEMGVTFNELAADAEREKLALQAEFKEKAERERDERDARNRKLTRETFSALLEEGSSVMIFDGVPSKYMRCGEGGELTESEIDNLAARVAAARGDMKSSPVYVNGRAGTFKAREVPALVSCTCGNVHTVRVFVSGSPKT